MIGNDLVALLIEHNTFIFFNTYIHILAGLLLAISIYPFISPLLKEKWNYFCIVLFPAFFGSVFPDLMFILTTLIEKRSLNGLFEALTHGGDVHSAFHWHATISLVIPTTIFLVMLMNKRKKGFYIDHLPKASFWIMSAISLFAALFHVYMDLVGF